MESHAKWLQLEPARWLETCMPPHFIAIWQTRAQDSSRSIKILLFSRQRSSMLPQRLCLLMVLEDKTWICDLTASIHTPYFSRCYPPPGFLLSFFHLLWSSSLPAFSLFSFFWRRAAGVGQRLQNLKPWGKRDLLRQDLMTELWCFQNNSGENLAPVPLWVAQVSSIQDSISISFILRS